jgi:hypothetical protein
VTCERSKLSAQLSALTDGDLAARDAEKLRAHVAGCEDCRRELTAIEALRTQLSSLPAPEGEDNWLAIAKKLNQPQPRRWSWRRWVLAPAFAAAAVASVVAIERRHGPSDEVLLREAEVEFRGAEAQYQRALSKLDVVVAHARVEWPEARQKAFDAARAQLGSATEECRKVAHASRADADAEELLFVAYRKQIHFYQEQLLQ